MRVFSRNHGGTKAPRPRRSSGPRFILRRGHSASVPALTLTDSEALALQAVIRIPGGAFIPVGGHMMATIQASALVQSPAGASSVRGVLVARGQLVPAAAGAVTVSLSVRRD